MTAVKSVYETQVAAIAELQRLIDSGQDTACISRSSELVARWPDFAPFFVLRGRALSRRGDYASALVCYQRALELKPDDVDSADGVAACLREIGRGDEVVPFLAERYYERPSRGTAAALMRAALSESETDLPLMAMLLHDFYPQHFAKFQDNEAVLSSFAPYDEWCAANGVPIDIFDAGGDISLRGVDGQRVQTYQAPAIKFSTVPNARIVAGLDWVVAPTGEFLDGSGLLALSQIGSMTYGYATFVPFISDPPRHRLLHARGKREIYVDEDVVFLSAFREHQFGHWLIDYLPRLIAWKWPGQMRRKIYTIAGLLPAQRETLTRFGAEPADIIDVPEDGTVYRFRSVTALHLGNTTRPAPAIVRFTYTALAAKQVPLSSGGGGARYFLERSQTKRGRSIANAEEFQTVLNEYGFETIRRPELTVSEQDSRFSEASIVVTPFGSDGYTVFQLRPGTDVVVLNFEDMEQVYPGIEQIMPRYCAILGMRYHVVSCGLARRPGKIAYHSDMIVDCDALRQTLRTIVARRAAT